MLAEHISADDSQTRLLEAIPSLNQTFSALTSVRELRTEILIPSGHLVGFKYLVTGGPDVGKDQAITCVEASLFAACTEPEPNLGILKPIKIALEWIEAQIHEEQNSVVFPRQGTLCHTWRVLVVVLGKKPLGAADKLSFCI